MNTKIALIAALAAVVVGCNKKSPKASALDINEPATPVYAAPQPVAIQQPVAQPVYDTQPTYATAQPISAQPAMATGGNYRVNKGDTLFSIAKSRYGNGNQWQRIAAANPGLTPQNLKAGQTIVIP